MFGYVMINKEELKIKEYNKYQSYYCGLCDVLRKCYGRIGQISLSYDMTFLVILLTALYEKECTVLNHRCIVHPVKKQNFLINEFTGYAADMTIILAYQNQRDDWEDDRNIIKYAASGILKHSYELVKSKYERQSNAVEAYIKRLHEFEKKNETNPDLPSGATGDMLKEIFMIRQDEWAEELSAIGFYLGKFIYLIDAYDDIEKDRKNGNYNPLNKYFEKDNFDERCRNILTLMTSECARAFEWLPITEDVSILRNILYSGIWCKFEAITYKRKKKEKEIIDNGGNK